jgi:nucleoside-diphosphate-sugar epimerase
LVRESGLQWTILRPTMIYGTPDDRNIARLIRFIDRSPVVPVVAPQALQQPIHVEDVAWAVAAALREPATIGRAYNIAGRDPVALRSLVEQVAAALGRRRLFVRVPLTPFEVALSLWAHVARPPIRVEQLHRIEEDKSFSYDDASRDFGFSPRDFRAGVSAEIDLYRRSS